MASAIDNARRRLAELEKEIKEIQMFIELHEHYSGLSTDPMQKGATGVVSSESRVVDKRPRRGPGLKPKGIADMVERLIRESGHPLTRGEIVEMLEARDVEMPAQDKPRYIGTIMWRNKSKFVNIEGQGYWLRGMPWPNLLNQISEVISAVLPKTTKPSGPALAANESPMPLEWDQPVSLSEEARKAFERQNK